MPALVAIVVPGENIDDRMLMTMTVTTTMMAITMNLGKQNILVKSTKYIVSAKHREMYSSRWAI